MNLSEVSLRVLYLLAVVAFEDILRSAERERLRVLDCVRLPVFSIHFEDVLLVLLHWHHFARLQT